MGLSYSPMAKLGNFCPKYKLTIFCLASGEEQKEDHMAAPLPLSNQNHLPSRHLSPANLPPLSVNSMLPTDCKEMVVLPRGLRTHLPGSSCCPTVPSLATSS